MRQRGRVSSCVPDLETEWEAIAQLLHQASEKTSTELLEMALSLIVQSGADWCGLFTREQDHLLCVMEQPVGTGWAQAAEVLDSIREAFEEGVEKWGTLSGMPCVYPLAPEVASNVQIYVVPFSHCPYGLAWIAPQARQRSLPGWSVLGGMVGLLLRNEALLKELEDVRAQSEKRLQEVATLYETALAMERGGLQRFLNLITERATQVMGAQACTLLLRHKDQPILTIGANYGLPPELVEEVQVPLGEGIAGRVALSGEPLMITDPSLDPRLQGVPVRQEISSSICVPLKSRDGNVFGVLTIRRLKPSPPFTQEDMRLFSIFASQVSLALANAQLYSDLNRRVSQLSTLVDLTQLVNSTLDIESLMGLIADQIREVVGFERCALFLPVDHSRLLVPRLLRGYHRGVFNPRGFRWGQGVVGLVAKKGLPLVVENAREEIQPMRGFGRMIGANSYAVLPIRVRGRCVGVVVADKRGTASPITSEQLDLLTAFVNQAGIALENARLYQEMEQRYREHLNLASYLDNILRSLGAGVFTLNQEGIITTWNQAAQQLTSWTSSQVRGRHYLNFFPAQPESSSQEGIEAVARVIEEVLQRGKAQSLYKVSCRWGDRLRYCNFTVSPLQDREGAIQGAVVVFEDISEQVWMEEQMNQMARLAEIGQMTAIIAHELRNPMTAIRGASQLLAQEAIPPSAFPYIEIITEEVKKLSQIADEFLEFARPLTLTLKPVQLDQIIQRTVRVFEPHLQEHRIQVKLELENLPVIEADPARLEQVLHNLIQNAIQAMPQGGELILRTGSSEGKVWFAVQDRGEGISEAIQAQIFNPFFTTRTKGTGLGLSIVKKIVEAHGGYIEVESREGEGTQMKVWLPCVSQDIHRAEVHSLHASATHSLDRG